VRTFTVTAPSSASSHPLEDTWVLDTTPVQGFVTAPKRNSIPSAKFLIVPDGISKVTMVGVAGRLGSVIQPDGRDAGTAIGASVVAGTALTRTLICLSLAAVLEGICPRISNPPSSTLLIAVQVVGSVVAPKFLIWNSISAFTPFNTNTSFMKSTVAVPGKAVAPVLGTVTSLVNPAGVVAVALTRICTFVTLTKFSL